MSVKNLWKIIATIAGLGVLGGCGEDTLAGLVCEADEVLEEGVCVPMCESPWTYYDGACVCMDGLQELEGECVPICVPGTHLAANEFGVMVCVSDCEEGWLWENGECVLICEEGLTAVDGECILVCGEGLEIVMVEGQQVCLPVCEEGTIRIGTDCMALGVIEGGVCNNLLGSWREGVTVTITLNDGSDLSTVTSPEGYFLLEGIPPGVYYVTFDNPADGFTNVLPAQVLAGQITFIGDSFCIPPPGHLKGAVCDVSTGVWVQGATVELDDANNTLTTTDQFGAFMFFSVPTGDYEVTITYPDASTEMRTATVLSSQVTDMGPAICEPPPDPCLGDYPIADAGADQPAAPDQTVQLNGSASFDPSGQTITYAWRVASRPIGSTAPLSNPNIVNPTILGDVSGDFMVCLIVTDTDGCESNEDCMNIHVAPQVAFHIELTWDTNQTDIDLHLMRPGGSWFDSGGRSDCYFMNMTPDWGPSGSDGSNGNDPHLDVDNVQGYGPENINMNGMWDGGPFVVGAHHWADHGGGATVSRIRIYVDGVMQFEAYSNATNDNDFWEVANVDVSNNGTSVVITPLNTYFVH